MDDQAKARLEMVDHQIAGRGISNSALLDAMRKVPREFFVPPHLAEFAYADTPLPVGDDQTVLRPYIVALMIESAQPRAGDRVLEVGTGSGYGTAILSLLVNEVYTIEQDKQLVELARTRFAELGYTNITVLHGDGTSGWPEHAPYQIIVVTAAKPQIPESLLKQLAVGGLWSCLLEWRAWSISCEWFAQSGTDSSRKTSARRSSFR
jgi:protein-L-isoaspartate(D-aspartate) O-methyltransferase